MGTDMSEGEVPEVQDRTKAANQDTVCAAGNVRHRCRHFIANGADGCYECGYLDGRRDGLDMEQEAQDEEERYGGLE